MSGHFFLDVQTGHSDADPIIRCVLQDAGLFVHVEQKVPPANGAVIPLVFGNVPL